MEKNELEASLEISRNLTGKIDTNASETLVIFKLLCMGIWCAGFCLVGFGVHVPTRVTLAKFDPCRNWLLVLFCVSLYDNMS